LVNQARTEVDPTLRTTKAGSEGGACVFLCTCVIHSHYIWYSRLLDVCTACAYEQPAYNPCRNRQCPKCQSLAQARWIDKRIERLSPVHYFHVVFTLPSELRTVAMRSREAVFDIRFASASQTLLELGRDPKRLGGELGVFLFPVRVMGALFRGQDARGARARPRARTPRPRRRRPPDSPK